jgi:hypothetical protein
MDWFKREFEKKPRLNKPWKIGVLLTVPSISRNQKCRILQQEKRKFFPRVGFVIGSYLFDMCGRDEKLLRGSDDQT